ncbi:MAG: hypothetical protein ACYC91_02290 [Solirubrobacteraceae bacterium]
MTSSRTASASGGFASTTAEYRRIANWLCDRPWHGELTWDRPLDTFTGEDLVELRFELVDAGRNASTVNHVRRIVRGAFRTHASSPALSWEWMSAKVESEGSSGSTTRRSLSG